MSEGEERTELERELVMIISDNVTLDKRVKKLVEGQQVTPCHTLDFMGNQSV